MVVLPLKQEKISYQSDRQEKPKRKQVTVREFQKLAVTKQLDIIAKVFLAKCTETGFVKNSYFAIKNYVKKNFDSHDLYILYEYFQTFDKKIMNVYEAFQLAERYRKLVMQMNRQNETKRLQVLKYDEFNVKDFINS